MSACDAVFRVESVLRKPHGMFADKEIRFFGRLVDGSLSIGDTVRVPILGGGFVEVTIARFTEDLSDNWIGLPFHNTVDADLESFCVCVDGSVVGEQLIAVPSHIEKVSEA